MIINGKWMNEPEIIALISQLTEEKARLERQLEQGDKRCKMIPDNPDCRGYADTFFCTNCQTHIDLGFISKSYDGNYCIECGAEVEDGETE
jgi:hypothetical protein